MQKPDPVKHIFKTAGAAAGLLTGMGFFGLIFGLAAGALLDQLVGRLQTRRKLRRFIAAPAELVIKKTDRLLTAASAMIITIKLSDSESASTQLIIDTKIEALFPALKNGYSDLIRDLLRTEDFTIQTAEAAADYFRRHSELTEKIRLVQILEEVPATENERALYTHLMRSAGIECLRSRRTEPAASANDGSEESIDLALLGLRPGAGEDDIKRVYRKLAADFHPDSALSLSENEREITSRAFIRITEAYERLSGRGRKTSQSSTR